MSEVHILSEGEKRPINVDDVVIYCADDPNVEQRVALNGNPIELGVRPKTTDELIADFTMVEYDWQQNDIARMLISKGDKNVIPKIEKLLETDNRKRRCNAAFVLAGLDDKRGLTLIIDELKDTRPRPDRDDGPGGNGAKGQSQPDPLRQITSDRYYAAVLLGQLGKNDAVPALIEATRDRTIDFSAAIALGQIGDHRAIPALREMVKESPKQRLWVGYALAALGEQEGFAILKDVALSDPSWSERRHAVESLGKVGDRRGTAVAIMLLKDKHPNVRVSAARALAQIGDRTALPDLNEALNDKSVTEFHSPTTVDVEAKKAIDAIKKNPVNFFFNTNVMRFAWPMHWR